MKKYLVGFIAVLLLTGCSLFVNEEKLEKEANTAFDKENFKEFNKLYTKLMKTNEDEAEIYLGKIKKHKYFNTQSSEDRLNEIEENIPSLKNEVINTQYKSTVEDMIGKINSDLKEVKSPAGINSIIYTLDSIDKMSDILIELEYIVGNANTAITTLEDIDIPENYKEMNDNLLSSIEQYRDDIQSKYVYYKENQADIVSSNTLLYDGNIFAMINSTDFSGEIEGIDANIELSVQTLEQRIQSVESKISK